MHDIEYYSTRSFELHSSHFMISGSLFALIAIEQQLSLLLASTLWNSVYEATVAISPALVFYIAAGACAILPLPLAM